MKLQLAIDNPISKPEALKMTETRLQNRLLRPGNELCRDMAQYSLVKTDQALSEVIAQLQLRIVQSRQTIQALNRQKVELEQELKVKAETLFIDETECMTMRHSISLQCF
jgi:ABC-type sugar transport system ATPase subunit